MQSILRMTGPYSYSRTGLVYQSFSKRRTICCSAVHTRKR